MLIYQVNPGTSWSFPAFEPDDSLAFQLLGMPSDRIIVAASRTAQVG